VLKLGQQVISIYCKCLTCAHLDSTFGMISWSMPWLMDRAKVLRAIPAEDSACVLSCSQEDKALAIEPKGPLAIAQLPPLPCASTPPLEQEDSANSVDHVMIEVNCISGTDHCLPRPTTAELELIGKQALIVGLSQSVLNGQWCRVKAYDNCRQRYVVSINLPSEDEGDWRVIAKLRRDKLSVPAIAPPHATFDASLLMSPLELDVLFRAGPSGDFEDSAGLPLGVLWNAAADFDNSVGSSSESIWVEQIAELEGDIFEDSLSISNSSLRQPPLLSGNGPSLD